jgi:hypothetical protein
MRKLLPIIAVFISLAANAQITTTKVNDAPKETQIYAYDSLVNYVAENAYQLKGQTLYLKENKQEYRHIGYGGFFKDYKKPFTDKSNIYECCQGKQTSSTSLAGRYFKVVDVVPHPKATDPILGATYSKYFYLMLHDLTTKQIAFFEYAGTHVRNFPFVVVGHFEKLKKEYIGTEFILRGRNWNYSADAITDINTGKPVDISTGEMWKCVDVTIEDKNYELALLLQNEKGERIAYYSDDLQNRWYGFTKKDASLLESKFGIDHWIKVLNGSVSVGMTKEMCLTSWGAPEKINPTITAGKQFEQWVYDNNYLYFDNNTLTAIQ